METTTKSEVKKYYYKSYNLPNNIVFSRDLLGNKSVFDFIIEPAENIGIGVGISCILRSDSSIFATNLDEKFDGEKYTDAFGDVHYKDRYNRCNNLYAIDGAPPIVSTVYGNENFDIERSLTDGNISRCFNSDGLLVLIIALNRHNLFIEHNALQKISNVYDRFNDKTFNTYSFKFDRNAMLTEVTRTSADESQYKSIASAYYTGLLVSGFTNSCGSVSMAYENSYIKTILSDLGYKLTFFSDKLEVKSTLTQVPDGAPTSTAPAINSWTFNSVDKVIKITDVEGNREIFKFNDKELLIGYYIETAGKITDAKEFNYNEDKLLVTVKKARDIFLNTYKYENYFFSSGEFSTYDYNNEGMVERISTLFVESDFVYKYVKTYNYSNYLVEGENISVYYKNISEPLYIYRKLYVYDSEDVLCSKEEYEQLSVEGSGSQVEEYKYDANGNLIKTISYNSYDHDNQFINQFIYDEYGRIDTVVDEWGTRTKFIYSSGSRQPNEKRILPNTTAKYLYDEAGRLTQINLDSLKNTITYRNNEVTQLADTETDADKLKFVYDNEHRIKHALLGTNILQSYSYEKSQTDKTITKTNALNETFKIVVQKDGKGGKTYYNGNLEFESNFESYTDDEDGYIWHYLTNNDKLTSQSESYYYSAYGTLSSYTVSTPLNPRLYNESYNYDYNGDITSINVSGILDVYYKFGYTATRQLASVQYDNVKVSYSYDLQQRLNGKEVYNGEQLIQKESIYYLAVGTSDITKLTHIPRSISFTNGTNTSKQSIWYDFDSQGRVSGITYDGHSMKYVYDKYNRLIRENNDQLAKTLIYDYDDCGNIKTVTTYPYTLSNAPTGGTVVNYTYSGNKLASYNGENCVYDAIGNPTTYRNKTATWKGRQMQSFNGIAFKYDGKGRRIGKGDVTYYYDSQDRLIKTSDGLEFFYDMTGLSSFKYNASMYFYRKDIQGNIIAILDSLGKVVVQYNYDAWGKCSVTATSAYTTIAFLNPFRYRGYYYDSDTRLYYLKTRYYDPEVGRFLNMDAVDYADPLTLGGLNLYGYCNNNPIMYVDPTRHFILQLVVSVISYVGIAIAAIFDSNIREDMNAIDWNPFNSDESAVVNSNSVSFYKGAPVFRTTLGRSGTFCAIFLSNNANETDVKHEYGHVVQQMIMGPITYGLMIGLPSWRKWSNRSYYDRPWEITADMFGGVTTRPHSQKDINRGKWYLAISNLFGPFGYFFLLGEY